MYVCVVELKVKEVCLYMLSPGSTVVCCPVRTAVFLAITVVTVVGGDFRPSTDGGFTPLFYPLSLIKSP